MNSAHEDKKIPAKLHTWGPGRLVNIGCSWRCRSKGSCSGGVWTAFSWKPLINTHRAHRSAVRSGGGSPCVVSSVPLCYSRPWLQAWQFSGVAPASSLLHGVNVFWAVCSLINAPRKLTWATRFSDWGRYTFLFMKKGRWRRSKEERNTTKGIDSDTLITRKPQTLRTLRWSLSFYSHLICNDAIVISISLYFVSFVSRVCFRHVKYPRVEAA